jgi:hypothetical protein
MANEAQILLNSAQRPTISTGSDIVSHNTVKWSFLFHKYVISTQSQADFVCNYAKQTQLQNSIPVKEPGREDKTRSEHLFINKIKQKNTWLVQILEVQ